MFTYFWLLTGLCNQAQCRKLESQLRTLQAYWMIFGGTLHFHIPKIEWFICLILLVSILFIFQLSWFPLLPFISFIMLFLYMFWILAARNSFLIFWAIELIILHTLHIILDAKTRCMLSYKNEETEVACCSVRLRKCDRDHNRRPVSLLVQWQIASSRDIELISFLDH